MVRGTVTERSHLSEDLEAEREFALHTPGGKHQGLGAAACLAYSGNTKEPG